jgi:hemerythrin
MAYIWDKNLETGNRTIDDQHRRLIDAINNLQTAKLAGKGTSQLEELMVFLITYTIKHFRDEEALQIKYQYPDYSEHKGQHTDFKKQVDRLMAEIGAEGPSPALVDKVTELIGSWLFNHIKGHDFKCAAYLRSMDEAPEADMSCPVN